MKVITACLVTTFAIIVLFWTAIHGAARAEVVKKFEFTSVLRDVEQSPGDNFKGYLFGKHQQFVIGSDDPSIKDHMDQLVNRKVRIILYEVAE